MKRALLPFFLLLFIASVGRAAEKPSKKAPLPQRFLSHVESLNQHVEAWQSKSEDAGRRTRGTLDRRWNQSEKWWTDARQWCTSTGHRILHGYQTLRKWMLSQAAEFESIRHQFNSFLNSK